MGWLSWPAPRTQAGHYRGLRRRPRSGGGTAAAGGSDVAADRDAQVFANPAGALTMVRYAQPVRVRQGRSWTAVDTRLRVLSDGSVAPVAAAAGLRLSGA